MAKTKDLRKKSQKDLEKEATKLRDSIAKTAVERYSTDDKNYKKMRNQRKELARILTVLNEDQEDTVVEADKKGIFLSLTVCFMHVRN